MAYEVQINILDVVTGNEVSTLLIYPRKMEFIHVGSATFAYGPKWTVLIIAVTPVLPPKSNQRI